MPEDFFGEEVAADYDADVAEMFATSQVAPAVDMLEWLADGGPALEDRWSGWTGEPFTADSRSHVSVWRKPG